MSDERLSSIQADARDLFEPLPCGVLIESERPLLTAAPGESLEAAVNRMWWRKVGALPVLHEGRLIGCFAEEDLLRLLTIRLRERAPDAPTALVWSELLGDVCVRDAMTPVGKLPVVRRADSLLRGLGECCAPDAPRGRYLFLVDAHDDGDSVQLASFRDVARLLTRVYAEAFDGAIYPDPGAATRAANACHRLLNVTLGTLREELGLGQAPNLIDVAADALQTVQAMADLGNGYVLVARPQGGITGICTRRDVLGGVRPRHADLRRLSLSRLMSQKVVTVDDDNTLCALFHLMASASCRHMPLVDEWDQVESVISMWEAVALVSGEGQA